MILSRKAELENQKKLQAELMRAEKLHLKESRQREMNERQAEKRKNLERIQALEDELLRELENKTRRSRNSNSKQSTSRSLSDTRSTGDSHLQQMRDLQAKAKQMMKGKLYLEEDSETPSIPDQNQEFLGSDEKQISIPVYIPQSMMRKAQRIPPPTIPHITRNGDVLNVHIISDPTYSDPLVRAEAQVERSEIEEFAKQMNKKSIKDVITDIQAQFESGYKLSSSPTKSQSLSPKKRKEKPREETLYLPKPDDLPVVREQVTPKGKLRYHLFREIPLDEVKHEAQRVWVSERMKQYSTIVKQNFTPKPDEMKQIELQLLREKSTTAKPRFSERVKLTSLSFSSM
ncbi:unnamed protein product [Blepharisma stoltei]|uniref:Uncharacterized protein n=1 Tax=Blepharisma stoltei TaxID=1481888 RepID=A0AAU9JFH1_9CILI|nr:unnamed protein product [Blepharisma stoltei]